MGCGACLSLKSIVKDGNLILNYSATQSSDQKTTGEEDTERYDAISPSASIRSDKSNHSFSSAARCHSHKQSADDMDDLKSDVPTLADTIADMQDFETQAGLSSASSPSHASTCWLDTRLHPLGVVTSSSQDKADIQSSNPTVGDLGNPSDVPSIHDDASIASACSEICVTFPGDVVSPTPAKHAHGLNRSSTSRARRGHSKSSNRDTLLSQLDRASIDHIASQRADESVTAHVQHLPKAPSLAGASNVVAALGKF